MANRTIDLINKYDFTIQKKYGQNFLMDDNILKGIVDTANVTKDDVVLEIGPGMGALTTYLCEAAGLVIAVEIDRMLIPILNETMAGYDNFVLVNKDVLKIDFNQLVSNSVETYLSTCIAEGKPMLKKTWGIRCDGNFDGTGIDDNHIQLSGGKAKSKTINNPDSEIFSDSSEEIIMKLKEKNKPETEFFSNSANATNIEEKNKNTKISVNKKIKVVANLPYYITTPIIMELLENQDNIASITVMVQKEVAERMQEGPGSKVYGALSLAVQYYSRPKLAMIVSKNCFLPKPDVDSAVINLDIYDKDERPVKADDPEKMFDIIRAAFNQRRKTLVNALSNAQNLNYTKDNIIKAITEIGKPETVRGEALTLEEFVRFSNLL